MQKGRSKTIADAERHRRTPRTLAIKIRAIKSMKLAGIGAIDEEQAERNMPEGHKKVPKRANEPSKTSTRNKI